MAKKQNLMLDAPKLSRRDLRHITWWMEGGYNPINNERTLSLQESMLLDKTKLRKLAHRYYKFSHHWATSSTKETYLKLWNRKPRC